VTVGDQPSIPTTTVRTVDCGAVAVEGRPVYTAGVCRAVHPACDVTDPDALPDDGARDLVVVTTDPKGRQSLTPRCWVVPANARPRVTAELVRARAEKLLPHPRLGTAPHAVTLVNIETVLWVDTAPDITLGTVKLLGYRVSIRAHLQYVHWQFGDDTTDARLTPDTPYSSDHPCTTPQCPDYYGHTYTRTGHLTIAADLHWSGQFRVDDGPWQHSPGEVTAPATGTPIHVREARGVLVPNP
jgi:hypothetical protein